MKSKTKRPSSSRRLRQHDKSEISTLEIMSLVCDYFCRGMPPTEICKTIEENHGITMSREEPYRYLSNAANRNLLSFVAPQESVLSRELLTKFSSLRGAEVIRTLTSNAVTDRAAEVIKDLVWSRARAGQRTVRLGFAGGRTVAQIARRLAVLLNSQPEKLPKHLICQSLVMGFDVDDLETNPIAFLAPLVSRPDHIERKKWGRGYLGFTAPAIVAIDERDKLLGRPWNERAVTGAKELDIVVCSGASVADRHSSLMRYYGAYQSPTEMADLLRGQYGCVADMLWLPITRTAKGLYEPFNFSALSPEEKQRVGFRAMTLIELSDLPALINSGRDRPTDVVLALGPCPLCQELKDDVLAAVLFQRQPLATHVLVDEHSARRMLCETRRIPVPS